MGRRAGGDASSREEGRNRSHQLPRPQVGRPALLPLGVLCCSPSQLITSALSSDSILVFHSSPTLGGFVPPNPGARQTTQTELDLRAEIVVRPWLGAGERCRKDDVRGQLGDPSLVARPSRASRVSPE